MYVMNELMIQSRMKQSVIQRPTLQVWHFVMIVWCFVGHISIVDPLCRLLPTFVFAMSRIRRSVCRRYRLLYFCHPGSKIEEGLRGGCSSC